MYSHTLLEFILPNLSPIVIDELRTCNRYLRDYIGRIRLDLPGHTLDGIDIRNKTELTGQISCSVSGEPDKSVTVTDGDFMKYLTCLEPKRLSLHLSHIIPLDPKWVGRIDDIWLVFHNPITKDELFRFWKNFSCTRLMFYATTNYTVDELLDQMPYVERLIIMGQISVSSKFVGELVEKTKRGPGIHEFRFGNREGQMFDADQLVYFIANASFPKAALYKRRRRKRVIEKTTVAIEVERVSGTRNAFFEILQELCKSRRWDFGSLHSYLPNVTTRNCEIQVAVHDFVEDNVVF